MRRLLIAVLAAGFVAAPIFAGALTLTADDPKANPEAVAMHAIVAAHTTACHSPADTVITATAEGIVNGKRVSMPLKVIRLKEPGYFAVAKEWKDGGFWVVKMIATNPEYKDYATGIVVPADGESGRSRAKVYYHAPTAAEVDAVLNQSAAE
jgi:hypothetical protein